MEIRKPQKTFNHLVGRKGKACLLVIIYDKLCPKFTEQGSDLEIYNTHEHPYITYLTTQVSIVKRSLLLYRQVTHTHDYGVNMSMIFKFA